MWYHLSVPALKVVRKKHYTVDSFYRIMMNQTITAQDSVNPYLDTELLKEIDINTGPKESTSVSVGGSTGPIKHDHQFASQSLRANLHQDDKYVGSRMIQLGQKTLPSFDAPSRFLGESTYRETGVFILAAAVYRLFPNSSLVVDSAVTLESTRTSYWCRIMIPKLKINNNKNNTTTCNDGVSMNTGSNSNKNNNMDENVHDGDDIHNSNESKLDELDDIDNNNNNNNNKKSQSYTSLNSIDVDNNSSDTLKLTPKIILMLKNEMKRIVKMRLKFCENYFEYQDCLKKLHESNQLYSWKLV